MKPKFYFFVIIFSAFISCNSLTSDHDNISTDFPPITRNEKLLVANGYTINSRYKTPKGYIKIKPNSDFGLYLTQLPISRNNKNVKYYDGTEKENLGSYIDVIDLKQSDKNIQYNANAIIRLRAEYLYNQKMYNEIDFPINEKIDIKKYVEYVQNDYSYEKFQEYLEYLLLQTTPNTILSKLNSIHWKEMQIGDVFIQKSYLRGHAAIVVDMAKNSKGEKIFILAQSFYPGQDIHIISNPNETDLSPWFTLNNGVILTSEWRFLSSDLMRFQ